MCLEIGVLLLFCSGLGALTGLALKHLSKPIATWGNNHWTPGMLLAMLIILLPNGFHARYLSVFSVRINSIKRFAFGEEVRLRVGIPLFRKERSGRDFRKSCARDFRKSYSSIL